MKNLFLVIMMTFIFVGTAFGEPFLVCDDPNPVDEVTGYILNFNQGEDIVGVAPLRYDLANLPNGSYTVVGRATNLWGVSEPASLDFTKGLPSVPMDVRISID